MRLPRAAAAAPPGRGQAGRARIGIVGTAALGRGAPGWDHGGAGADGASVRTGRRGTGVARPGAARRAAAGDGSADRRRHRLARSRKNLSWPGRRRRGMGTGRDRGSDAAARPACPVANGGRNGHAGARAARASAFCGSVPKRCRLTGSAAASFGALFATRRGLFRPRRSRGLRRRLPRRPPRRRARLLFERPSRRPRGAAPAARHRRRASWSGSSYRVTPSSGNKSRITFGLTSSSRASSLMRILLIHATPAV